MARGIIIQLTTEQQVALAPLFEKIRGMAYEGKPGMAVAQIYVDHMFCGAVPHDKAIKIQKILTGTSGNTSRSAYDRADANLGGWQRNRHLSVGHQAHCLAGNARRTDSGTE